MRLHEVPESVRQLCPFEPDYVDLFAASVPGARETPPEQWARATMEGAPAPGRFLAWRVLCNLRLEHGASPDWVAGWRIAGRGDDWIRVEARSWFMTANIVLKAEEERVLFATFVRCERSAGRLIWTPVAAVHRAVAPDFLGAGVRRVARAGREARR